MSLKDSRNSNQTGPEFLCIGMQKAATRWLYDQLRSHIDVWMPPIKEFHFLAMVLIFVVLTSYAENF